MYINTRENDVEQAVFSYETIIDGIAPTGGLFVPAKLPKLNYQDWINKTYQEIAVEIFDAILAFDNKEDVKEIVNDSYNTNFASEEITPIKKVGNVYVMELFHGPTGAFKDIALQALPHLMVKSKSLGNKKEDTAILVATSGDTGKAALEGFKNVDGIKVICLYPHEGVSKMQDLQMRTTDGHNTHVIAVKGNFDDCQAMVKEIFGDENFKSQISNYTLSSANSINWGRLMPQIVYYFYSYIQLVKQNQIRMNDKINICIPTGNFGNILAGYYAKEMGIPIEKLICASNKNNILTDFFKTGHYDKNRDFHKTNTPSMDILVSSNLERYLFEKSNKDDKLILSLMRDLSKNGKFEIGTELLAKINKEVFAGYATEMEILDTIKDVYSTCNYVLDPHTAVGYKVYQDYIRQTGDDTPTLLGATATPFKFSHTVMKAITGENMDEEKAIKQLEVLMNDYHAGVKDLEKKPILHNTICEINEIKLEILKILS
ncbi:threonine synthase [Candidatus Epulonipiscium fishelsonii]|uniref:Threonine synthase n=1 Tax=Candidatus Epulonipiscium fishelsonii TaxID=77094 RepID=A0ACC8X8L1_9FIRM|nr:threonine synthase [Epulopiscium sp. SCG-B11WGA-EpuloA1]ONI38402.1 threonine synthase [Epulopiscium sp. SCG-B05WGA-EpuloA1]